STDPGDHEPTRSHRPTAAPAPAPRRTSSSTRRVRGSRPQYARPPRPPRAGSCRALFPLDHDGALLRIAIRLQVEGCDDVADAGPHGLRIEIERFADVDEAVGPVAVVRGEPCHRLVARGVSSAFGGGSILRA